MCVPTSHLDTHAAKNINLDRSGNEYSWGLVIHLETAEDRSFWPWSPRQSLNCTSV